MKAGLIYAFTGDGKGKTSAGLGVAVRALLNGEKVVWIAFYKQETWGLSEAKLQDKFPNLEMKFVGRGFRIANGQQLVANGKTKIAKVAGGAGVVVDTATEEEHKLAVHDGLGLVAEKLQQKPFLLVMDEVLNALSEGLIESRAVAEILKHRGGTHIVLTGRANKRTSRLLQGADLVTECKKIKHPYDKGSLAVKGLDF